MENYTTDVAAAGVGAALPGVCSPWASLPAASAAGASYVRTPNPALAAGVPGALLGAFRPAPAMTQPFAVPVNEHEAVNGTRKQNVHKTRIDAGGYGAMGPQPEREPA